MKALIILREKDCGWLRNIFPNTHPTMFPICNKPLLEYLVDFCILNGCSDVRMVMDEPGTDVEIYFNTGSRWGISISFGSFRDHDTIDHILEKNSRYCQEGSLLLLDGFFFIHYDKEKNYGNWQKSSNSSRIINCQTGSVLYARDKDCLANISSALTKVDFALSPLESLDDIFNITMQVLAAEQQHYVLPGYGIEKGITLGRNVEIGKNVIVTEPVVIGDNVRLLGDSVVGPFSVIGNNVIIDDGTHVTESVILEDSYLGSNLTFEQKVVKGNHVFTFGEQESIVIDDTFLVSAIQHELPLPTLHLILNSLAALTLTTLLGIPYLLLAGIRKLQGDWHRQRVTYFKNHRKETFAILRTVNNSHSLAGKLFSILFLDRLPLFLMALRGKLQLVGNRLLEASEKNSDILTDFQDYLPGVFGYSEAENVKEGSLESNITERFYAAHRGFLQSCRVLTKILCTSFIIHR